MATDLDEVFARGGAHLYALLDYCVFSVQLDPLFVYLVSEYRYHPTSIGAIGLYDVFLAPEVSWNRPAASGLPRHGHSLEPDIARLRRSVLEFERVRREDPDAAVPPLLPAKYLFDALVARVRLHPGDWRTVAHSFDPQLTPLANLPGGRLSAGQRAFVEGRWRPRLRPQLVAAGFWRVATVGG